MLLATGLDRYRHFDLVEIERGPLAVMVDRQDVELELRDVIGESGERAGTIGYVDP